MMPPSIFGNRINTADDPSTTSGLVAPSTQRGRLEGRAGLCRPTRTTMPVEPQRFRHFGSSGAFTPHNRELGIMHAFGGKRPRKEPLFGGARLTLEIGSDFPIGLKAASRSGWQGGGTGEITEAGVHQPAVVLDFPRPS